MTECKAGIRGIGGKLNSRRIPIVYFPISLRAQEREGGAQGVYILNAEGVSPKQKSLPSREERKQVA